MKFCTKIIKVVILSCLIPSVIFGKEETDLNSKVSKSESLAVFIINIVTSSGESSGTGFACIYKGKEFVATNLHVIDNAKKIELKSQNGVKIPMQNRIIACEDADIALIPIEGTFAALQIKPFEFMEKVFEQSKAGDEITCLGNSLGNGVISATVGTIKAFGEPQIEIDCPVVHGNSGGPIIHNATGKVVGLVTEAIVNKMSFDELGLTASKSEKSSVSEISYFGHRIDTSKKWSAATLSDFLKNSETITSANQGLTCAALFVCEKAGWEDDRRISDAWNTYSKFLKQADARDTKRLETTELVNIYGVVVRRDTKIKGLSVAQADYDKARTTFVRAVEWKILADKEALEKVTAIGYLQTQTRKYSMEFSVVLIKLAKEL
jgi:hypothetical protein